MKELSIDELLAKAEALNKPRRKSENNTNVLKYIDRIGWESGTVAIPTYAIFYHYRSIYDLTHDKAKANKTVFFRTFNKKFPSYRKNKQRYYLLNDGILNLTEEFLKTARTYDKQHWNRKAKKVRLSGQEGDNQG